MNDNKTKPIPSDVSDLEQYHQAFYKCDEQDQTGQKKYYELMVQSVFYGEKWTVGDRYSFLGFLTAYKREFLGPDLWAIWRELDYRRVVCNDETISLANAMAQGFANRDDIFYPVRDKADEFLDLFPEKGLLLLNLIRSGKIFIAVEGYLWVKKKSKLGEMAVFTPRTWPILIDVTGVMEENLLRCKINFRFLNSAGKEGRIALQAEDLDKWLAVMPREVLESRENLFGEEFGTKQDYYCMLLATKQGSGKYRQQIMVKLAKTFKDGQSRNKFTLGDPHINLGIPFNIPPEVEGVLLCRMLQVLDLIVKNFDFIKNLPSEDDFKVRALSALLTKRNDWYVMGRIARESLQNKINSCR